MPIGSFGGTESRLQHAGPLILLAVRVLFQFGQKNLQGQLLGSGSLSRDKPWPPALGAQSLSF